MSSLVCLSLLLALTLFALAAADGLEVAVQTDGTSNRLDPPLTLKYWDGRGLMEISRMILAIAGKFPEGDYEDARFSSPPKGLKSNLGRMPVLSVGAADVGQSLAIHYYLAAQHELLGTSTLEAAQILSIVEHVREMGVAYRALVPYGQAPDERVTAKWFEEGSSDVLGTADASRKGERYLTWWLGRIEQALDTEGFAVGNQLSLADLYLYNALQEVWRAEEVRGGEEGAPQWRREPFGDLAAMDKKLSQYPRLAASCDAVSGHANVQQWLASRGVQSF